MPRLCATKLVRGGGDGGWKVVRIATEAVYARPDPSWADDSPTGTTTYSWRPTDVIYHLRLFQVLQRRGQAVPIYRVGLQQHGDVRQLHPAERHLYRDLHGRYVVDVPMVLRVLADLRAHRLDLADCPQRGWEDL